MLRAHNPHVCSIPLSLLARKERERRGQQATKPKLAAYTHFVNGIPGKVEGITSEEMISHTKENYDRDVVLGQYLMSFLITDQAELVGLTGLGQE